MFVVLLKYLKPLNEIEQYRPAHRAYLDQGYAKNYLLVSGPQNPRVGGVIVSQLQDRQLLEQYLANDPFQLNGITSYTIIEFDAIKYHPLIASLISK